MIQYSTTVKVVEERYQKVLHWLERDTIQYYCEGCRRKIPGSGTLVRT